MKKYFITATGTGIGKTFITCDLIRQIKTHGKTARALKPIISGWEDSDTDTHKIIAAQGGGDIENISPWRFSAPLSPDIAAKAEGKLIDFDAVVNFCKPEENADYLLIEGVGGVMVPLTENKTIADLITALDIPAIVVAGTYLGSISHTLTALTTLAAHNINVAKLVVNQSQDCVGADAIIASLINFTDVPIVFLPYGGDCKELLNKL
jgi:dethiobiotin synthetase